MDPNANIAEQRAIARRIVELQDRACANANEAAARDAAIAEEGARLAELVQALDEWLVGGGFLPGDWSAPARTAAALRGKERCKRWVMAEGNLARHLCIKTGGHEGKCA